MLERLLMTLDDRFVDTAKVLVPNGAVLALVHLVDVKTLGEVVLLGLSAGYTVWRWRRDSYVACEGCRNGHVPNVCPLAPRRRPWWCPKRV